MKSGANLIWASNRNANKMSSGAHLRVQRRRLEAELMNVGKERSVQLLARRRDVPTALPLRLCRDFCIAWRSCGGTGSHTLASSMSAPRI